MVPSPSSSAILVEVGAGELIDKITILEIKRARMVDPIKREHVLAELAMLNEAKARHDLGREALASLESRLKAVNADLWTIEDRIRACEAREDFGPDFVALARAVYITNDRRAALKREINLVAGSTIVEEKSYGP